MELLWTLLIGALVGWLAGLIVEGEGLGLIGDVLIGILGAWLGGFIARLLGIVAYGLVGRLAVAVGGAVILLMVLRAIFSGKKRRR
jgi:uncharacterized membrane protein YeaQ/YmgE (transglycosylase-associated protein family)